MKFLIKKLRFAQKKRQILHGNTKINALWTLVWLPAGLTILLNFHGYSQNKSHLLIVKGIDAYQKQLKHAPGNKLVNITYFINPVNAHIYYTGTENFTKTVLYGPDHGLYLVEKAARQLALVQDSLQKMGLDILIFDCYRPYSVTKKMWQIVPDERYAANPAKGSGHNRGAAIDLTLVDAHTKIELEMPTGYDNFSDTAHQNFAAVSPAAKQNRALLKNIMIHFGFVPLPTEWWHFSLPDAAGFPVFDLSFSELKKLEH